VKPSVQSESVEWQPQHVTDGGAEAVRMMVCISKLPSAVTTTTAHYGG
jgi:hypothetical protein